MKAFGQLGEAFKPVAAIGVATAIMASPACADDRAASATSASAMSQTETCLEASGKTMSMKDAMALSKSCDAVIYYGNDISSIQAEADAEALRDYDGLNVVSVGGSPAADQVAVFINGQLHGGMFTEAQMLQGQVGSEIVLAHRAAPEQVASLD